MKVMPIMHESQIIIAAHRHNHWTNKWGIQHTYQATLSVDEWSHDIFSLDDNAESTMPSFAGEQSSIKIPRS